MTASFMNKRCQILNTTLNLKILRASLVAQMVKDPPAMQETWVQSLGWEDPLEEGMATHSSILFLKKFYWSIVASLIAQLVKDPPAMQETPV